MKVESSSCVTCISDSLWYVGFMISKNVLVQIFKKKKRLDRIISANKKVNLKWKIFDPTVNFSQISCHNSGTISSLDLKFSVFYFDNTYQW